LKAVNTYTRCKIKQNYKHAREGAHHITNETKIDTITLQAQNIKHLPHSHIQKD
jgi:hypothetical protein